MTHVLSLESLSAAEAAELIGYQDRNLNLLCELFQAEIVFRDQQFLIRAQQPQAVQAALQEMLKLVRQTGSLSEQEIRYLVRRLQQRQQVDLEE